MLEWPGLHKKLARTGSGRFTLLYETHPHGGAAPWLGA